MGLGACWILRTTRKVCSQLYHSFYCSPSRRFPLFFPTVPTIKLKALQLYETFSIFQSKMGNAESSIIPPLQDYCKDQMIQSKRCILKSNYDETKYRSECTKEFEEYKECKRKWILLRNGIRNGTFDLTKEIPTSGQCVSRRNKVTTRFRNNSNMRINKCMSKTDFLY